MGNCLNAFRKRKNAEGNMTSPRPSASLTFPFRLTVSNPGFQKAPRAAGVRVGAGETGATKVPLVGAVLLAAAATLEAASCTALDAPCSLAIATASIIPWPPSVRA